MTTETMYYRNGHTIYNADGSVYKTFLDDKNRPAINAAKRESRRLKEDPKIQAVVRKGKPPKS